MKQTTKFLHIVMCMALGLSVSLTSCKDYDDDIDGLNQRIDGVVSDLNSLKEIVNGLVKSVTYDEATGKLTVTPVTGEALIYSVGENVEVPEYELKKDGNAFWLEKDGVQTGDKVEVSIPEVDEFDPALLSVRMENGEYVVYYGDEPTQATIPVPANNSIVKNGNEAEASIKCIFRNKIFTAPSGCNIVRMIMSETNCGTAIERIKQNRQNPFPFVSLRLMTMASIIPNT